MFLRISVITNCHFPLHIICCNIRTVTLSITNKTENTYIFALIDHINSTSLKLSHQTEICPHWSSDKNVIKSITVDITRGDSVAKICTYLITRQIVQVCQIRIVEHNLQRKKSWMFMKLVKNPRQPFRLDLLLGAFPPRCLDHYLRWILRWQQSIQDRNHHHWDFLHLCWICSAVAWCWKKMLGLKMNRSSNLFRTIWNEWHNLVVIKILYNFLACYFLCAYLFTIFRYIYKY